MSGPQYIAKLTEWQADSRNPYDSLIVVKYPNLHGRIAICAPQNVVKLMES